MFFNFLYQGRRPYVTDVQSAAHEVDLAGFAAFDGTYLQRFLSERVIGADAETTAARVAKLLERQHVLFNGDNGAVLADLPALTARRTFFQIDLRYVDRHLAGGGDLRPQKKMAVRFLNIAVEVLNFLPQLAGRLGKIHGDRGLARPPLAAGDSHNKVVRHVTDPFQNEIARSGRLRSSVPRF